MKSKYFSGEIIKVCTAPGSVCMRKVGGVLKEIDINLSVFNEMPSTLFMIKKTYKEDRFASVSLIYDEKDDNFKVTRRVDATLNSKLFRNISFIISDLDKVIKMIGFDSVCMSRTSGGYGSKSITVSCRYNNYIEVAIPQNIDLSGQSLQYI